MNARACWWVVYLTPAGATRESRCLRWYRPFRASTPNWIHTNWTRSRACQNRKKKANSAPPCCADHFENPGRNPIPCSGDVCRHNRLEPRVTDFPTDPGSCAEQAASDRGLLCVMAQARLSDCEQQIMTLDVLCQQMLRHIQALSRSSLQSGVLFSCYLRACFSCLITAVMLSAFMEDWTQRTCFHYEETSIFLHILSLASVFLAVQYHIRAANTEKNYSWWVFLYDFAVKIYIKKKHWIYLRINTELNI